MLKQKSLNNTKTSFSLSVGLISLALLSGGFLASSFAFADTDVVDQVNISVPISCSLEGTGMNTHNAEIANGSYNSAIGETTLKAYCNDSEGFAIYAIGYTDNTLGKNVLTNSTLGSTYDIATGTATSGNNSQWAMKLATVSNPVPNYPIIIAGSSSDSLKEQGDPDFSSFQGVPDEYKKVAYRASGTDIGLSAEGSTLKTTYQAYVSKTQPAGTYTGQVKYTLVHPVMANKPVGPEKTESGKACYYPNGINVVGTMGCTLITGTTFVDLLASNFSRDGYGFAGWSDSYDYATNANAKFYGPQERITFTAGQYTGANNGLSLYAVWVPSAGSLQDSTKVSELCGTGTGSLTIAPTDGTADLASVSALTDQRDNQTYAIAKLADGNCWMIENLRLESRDTKDQNRFNSSITNESLAQGYGKSTTYGSFSGLADAEYTDFGTYTANSLYYSGTQEGTATINIGTSNYPSYRIPRYNNLNTQSRASNPTSNSFTDNNTTGGMYSYGNYYTWHAAIADLTYNDTNNSSMTNTSLCPSGWRLPRGGNKARIESNDDNNFWNLIVDALNGGIKPTNYGSGSTPYYNGTAEGGPVSIKLRSYPNNFLGSGYFNSSSTYDRGSRGYYWSSTVSSNGGSYRLLFYNNSYVYPGDESYSKSNGYSIRCIAEL